jgi:chaperonin GroES
MSKIKPLNGIIVLKKVDEEEQTYGQIVIPDMGKEKPEIGIVVETSDTYNWHKGDYYKTKVQVGDKVVIPKMGSMVISNDGEDYILIKETEILAVLEK